VALGKVAACFGVIAGVATIFSGAMTYMDGWDRHKSEDIWAGGLQAAGGLLSVGGFLLSNPYLQIAGTLLLLAAVATGNWTAIKEWLDDVSTPGTKKVFLKLVDSVGSAGIFERAAKQKASLKTAYDALLEATKTDRLALGDPFDTAEVRSALKGLGFADKTIEGMTFRPMNPRLHPWPSP
jgi:ABC-type branched-subunit amino acid transport system substrate-binding protein